MVSNMALLISTLLGLSLSLFMVFVSSAIYNKSNKKQRSGKLNPNDWLFYDFAHKTYSAIFGRKDEEEVAIGLGIDVEKYYKSCKLTKTTPDVQKLIVYNLYGIGCALIFGILCILVSPFFFIIGICLFFYFVFYEQRKLNSKATEMRNQIANELPRFLDLLSAELAVGVPIESAIYLLCDKMDSLLASEFKSALSEMQLGYSGWQQALSRMAERYDVETLSDFVMNVTTSYNRGTSIARTVAQKAKDVRKTHLLSVKEKAGKTTNTILLPMTIFQFVPMIAFLLVPALFQISGSLI